MIEKERIKEKLRNQALRFLSFRARSELEIKNYLEGKLKKANLEVYFILVKELIQDFKKVSLLDDFNFAVFWVENRLKFKKKSFRIIKKELENKGIDQSSIKKIFADLDPKIEEDQAFSLAKKRLKTIKEYSEKEKQKLAAFLLRRGYGWGIIKKIVDTLLPKD